MFNEFCLDSGYESNDGKAGNNAGEIGSSLIQIRLSMEGHEAGTGIHRSSCLHESPLFYVPDEDVTF